jgi:hypothetical protein
MARNRKPRTENTTQNPSIDATQEIETMTPTETSAPESTEVETAQADSAPTEVETTETSAPDQADTAPEVESTPDEIDEKRLARSAKLRAAMLAAHAAPFDPTTNPHHGANAHYIGLTLPGEDEPTVRPARPYFKYMSDFSDKSAVTGVQLDLGDGELIEVEARRTRGVWKGVTTSFLWFEAEPLAFPASMNSNPKNRPTLTYHVMIENGDWDNLDGAVFTIIPDEEKEAHAATAARPPIESAVAPAPTPKAETPVTGADAAPTDSAPKAKRVRKPKNETAAA